VKIDGEISRPPYWLALFLDGADAYFDLWALIFGRNEYESLGIVFFNGRKVLENDVVTP